MADEDLYAYTNRVMLERMDAKKTSVKDYQASVKEKQLAKGAEFSKDKVKYMRLKAEAETASGETQAEGGTAYQTHDQAAVAHRQAAKAATKLGIGYEKDAAKHKEAAEFHAKEASALVAHDDAQKKLDEAKSKLSPSTRANAARAQTKANAVSERKAYAASHDEAGNPKGTLQKAGLTTEPENRVPSNREVTEKREGLHTQQRQASLKAKAATDRTRDMELSFAGKPEQGKNLVEAHAEAADLHHAGAVHASAAGKKETAKAHEAQASQHEEAANHWAAWDAEHSKS